MHLKSAPAWSIASRYSSKSEYTGPGPGSYNHSTLKYDNSPSFRIGTSSRSNVTSSTGPGPGSYDLRSSLLNKPSAKFGSSKRTFLEEKYLTPGPGAYSSYSRAVEGPKYSMQGRRSYGDNSRSPGPGRYDQSFNDFTLKDKSPSYSMGSRYASRPLSANPGPGSYRVGKADTGPKWGFGTQSRIEMHKSTSPGPGSYNFGSTLDHRGYSMRGRRQSSDKYGSNSPGPGAYTTYVNRAVSPSWSMGRASRKGFVSNKGFPGPGTSTRLRARRRLPRWSRARAG